MIRVFLILLFMGWVVTYIHYSNEDSLTCAKNGVPFGGESLNLDGYCLSGSIMVPVENYHE